MYARALIVVLAILNAGVALWWALRPAPLPPVPPETAPGVASLQLLEAAAAPAPTLAAPSTPAPAAAAASVPATPAPQPAPSPAPVPTPVETDRCLSFGPYPSREGAEATRSVAAALLSQARVREAPGGEAGSYRVMLRGVGDRAAAQAQAARLQAAGVADYYLIGQGEAYDIALGRYRSREGAERRLAELAGKGVSAEVLPSGEGAGARWWLDARTRASDTALQALRAPGQRRRDCTALR